MQRSSWMHDLELYRMQPGCLLGARSLRVAEAVSARCSSNLFCTAWTAALRTAGCGGNGRCLKPLRDNAIASAFAHNSVYEFTKPPASGVRH